MDERVSEEKDFHWSKKEMFIFWKLRSFVLVSLFYLFVYFFDLNILSFQESHSFLIDK